MSDLMDDPGRDSLNGYLVTLTDWDSLETMLSTGIPRMTIAFDTLGNSFRNHRNPILYRIGEDKVSPMERGYETTYNAEDIEVYIGGNQWVRLLDTSSVAPSVPTYDLSEIRRDGIGWVLPRYLPDGNPVDIAEASSAPDASAYRYRTFSRTDYGTLRGDRLLMSAMASWEKDVFDAGYGTTNNALLRGRFAGRGMPLEDVEIYVGSGRWMPVVEGRSSSGSVVYQRSTTGTIRGATEWDARRQATMDILPTADISTAVHEAFHIFAEELDPSAKANAAALHSAETGRPNVGWTVEVEEWMAYKFEDWARSGDIQNNTLNHNFSAFANYARDVLHLPDASLSDEVKDFFEKAHSRASTIESAHFDVDQQRLWEATRTALVKAEDQAYKTHYYARGRNWLERSLNHPYLGLYPLSYMWGKVLPEMLRFLLKKPFGLNAPLGGLVLAKHVWQAVQLQVQTDPELREWLEEHPETIRLFQLMVPGTPWESPVNMPIVMRRAMQNNIENQKRVANGDEPVDFRIGQTFDDMVGYSLGVGHFAGTLDDIRREWTQTKKKAEEDSLAASWAQGLD